eukprot:TRINITY_DN617_c0_g2_i2.p1 TRINITY_DN617_c0_g2~~TRINITY_DN617_c0_g2_i2.p1  ORF type:complete len:891 (-),score=149.85 TRINITY_DN617_c0_g2_i2:639-3311(-)
MSTSMGDTSPGGDNKKKKHHNAFLNRDVVIKRMQGKTSVKKASPMVLLKEIFEETEDKDRFVGDTMFWKYFEDIDIQRIYHTNSVEYRNLKVMCWETVFYIVVLLTVTIYAYQLQSQDVFEARREQLNYWQGCDANGNCNIQKVENIQGYWNWMQTQFVPLAFDTDPNTQRVAKIHTKFTESEFPLQWTPRFVGPQMSNVLLGTIRMRQARVMKNQGCSVSKLVGHAFPDCYGTFSPERESKEAYQSRYAPTYLEDAYYWKSESETHQVSARGVRTTYSGAGFMTDLPVNKSHTRTMIDDMWKWNWIDKLTRAVIIEITVLNTNVNVIVNTNIVFEFTPNGGVTGTVRSTAVRSFMFTPSLQSGSEMIAFIVMVILLCVFTTFSIYTLWLMYKTCFNFLGENPILYLKRNSFAKILLLPFRVLFQFFRYGWNTADFLIMVNFIIHISYRLNAFRSVTAEPNLAPNVVGHPERFMPFAKIIDPLTMGNNMLAFLTLLVWVKLFKYLCMSSYFRLLVRILERCGARLINFSVLLLVVFLGFAVAFSIGLGNYNPSFGTIADSFLVLFFLLIDGFTVDPDWFSPGRDQLMTLIFVAYVAQIYFVLLNIFIAIVLDTYSLAAFNEQPDPTRKNPMQVFLVTYYHWMKGQSLVTDDAEEHLKADDLSIKLALLPGLVRRKYVEKKRNMQRVANDNFAGMDLFPEDDQQKTSKDAPKSLTDWALPSSQTDVFDTMTQQVSQKPMELYDIPEKVFQKEVTRAQLQRLMDEDGTIPLLLGCTKAVDVIRKFKNPDAIAADAEVSAVKAMQGSVFGRIDKLERVKLDEDVPRVPEISAITEEMSGAITDVRNQFRVQLTGIIEATADLFEHLVELTQGVDELRMNNDNILEMVAKNAQL